MQSDMMCWYRTLLEILNQTQKYQNKNGFAEENTLFDDRLSSKTQKYLFFCVCQTSWRRGTLFGNATKFEIHKKKIFLRFVA